MGGKLGKPLFRGQCGFKNDFKKLKSYLKLHAGSKDLVVSGESTKTKSGFFEVIVDDKLVHSKKGGDGLVNTREKLQKINAAIKSAIEDAEHNFDQLEH